jgi:hypothetical protein
MSVFLAMMNAVAAFILFFSMSGITEWVIYASGQAKIFPFLLGIALVVNAVYMGMTRGEAGARRGV